MSMYENDKVKQKMLNVCSLIICPFFLVHSGIKAMQLKSFTAHHTPENGFSPSLFIAIGKPVMTLMWYSYPLGHALK